MATVLRDKEDFIRVGALDLGVEETTHVNIAGIGRVRVRHET
jgi:hypothetical protein